MPRERVAWGVCTMWLGFVSRCWAGLGRGAFGLLLLGWTLVASAQTYVQASTTYAWVSTSGHSTASWSRGAACSGGGADRDDDVTAELPLGFTFVFGGSKYTTLRIMTNGRLQFSNTFCGYGTNSTSPRTYPYPYPDANLVRTMSVYGADIDMTSGGGKVFYSTIGTAPNRQFVVTWEDVEEWSATGSLFNFQVILNESGDFIYQYGPSVNRSGGKAQIGWEVTTSNYAVVSYTNIGSLNKTAMRFYDPTAVALPGGFNVFDSSTLTGLLTGAIQTKVAGAAFSLDVIALNTARTGLLTTFTGAVAIDILNGSDNSGALSASTGCRSTWTVIQTLAGTRLFGLLNAGRLTVTGLTENNAWRDVRIRVTHTPASGAPVIGCSSDNFAIRPASFSAPVASDADWRTAGSTRSLANASAAGGNVHAAGRPFRVAFNALNALGAVTTGYTGSPSLVFEACSLPATCAGASAASLVAPLSVSAGAVSSVSATYSEAGSFSASAQDSTFAAVDALDGTPLSSRLIRSTSAVIGRFVPDRYLLNLSNAPVLAPGQGSACTTRSDWNFTWVGQPFAWATAPVITVTAQDANGQTVQQYAGSLFKLAASAVSLTWGSNAPVGAPLSVTGQTVALAATGAGQASLSFGTAASFVFTRPLAPLAPFNAVISATVSLADASEAGVSGNGSINALAPLIINGAGAGIEFTGGNAAGANLLTYGRLQLSNAHGDSRRPLSLLYEAQAWSGAAWYRNHRDSCLQPAAAAVVMSNWSAGLTTCDVSLVTVSRASRGQGAVQLNAPVAAKTGGLDVSLRLNAASGTGCVAGGSVAGASAALPWLQGPWTSAPDYLSDPLVRASFGRLRTDSLIRREIF